MFSLGIHIFHTNLAFMNLAKCWNLLKNEAKTIFCWFKKLNFIFVMPCRA